MTITNRRPWDLVQKRLRFQIRQIIKQLFPYSGLNKLINCYWVAIPLTLGVGAPNLFFQPTTLAERKKPLMKICTIAE
jgi:hypothetical protein